MWQQLFVNGCILITVIFISNMLFENRNLGRTSSWKVKTLFGITGGISACILIYFGIHITPTSFLDFRHLIFILVAFIGGFFPVILSGLIAAAYRLVHNGISNVAIFTSFSILFVSFSCGLISQLRLPIKKQLGIMFLLAMIVRSSGFFIEIPFSTTLMTTIIGFWSASIIVGYGVYQLVLYIFTANKSMQRLRQESSHDYLTGLKNTRQFDLMYNEIVDTAIRDNNKVSLLMLDIDFFKSVNDTYGHIAGDFVLKEFGQIFLATFREDDFAARIGGEEFAVILNNLSMEKTIEIAERLRSAIEAHRFTLLDKNIVSITVSIGVAMFPDTVDDVALLKNAADQKLYEAKTSGRNKVCY